MGWVGSTATKGAGWGCGGAPQPDSAPARPARRDAANRGGKVKRIVVVGFSGLRRRGGRASLSALHGFRAVRDRAPFQAPTGWLDGVWLDLQLHGPYTPFR